MLTRHDDVAAFRQIVRTRLGLDFADDKLDELSDVLRERMHARGETRVDGYARKIDDAEIGELASRLSVGETYFFRYREQFDAFREAVIPSLRAREARPIRIASAGCSTGEEAYSIAILARELGVTAEIEVVAFDVNPTAVERARQARYSAWALRETPASIRERYFARDGAFQSLARDVRAGVRVEQRNLLDPGAFDTFGAFDVVFCRNVLMYFDHETMRAVVRRIARALSPGGYLFLGHAETLRGVSTSFALCHTHGTFYYRRKTGRDEATRAAQPGVGEPRRASDDALALLGADDDSWIDVIRRASERVTALTSTKRGAAAGAPPAAKPDTRPVFDMLERERFADALELLGTFAASTPETQLLRAALLTNTGDLPEAERACAALLAEDELNAGAHYLMALCREHAGDDASAREHDRAASYLDPTFAMPHVHLGLLERRSGNAGAAAAELGRALELLGAEDPARVLLFGGGFGREALASLCQSELRRCRSGQ